MDYVLVNDSCNECEYVTNAFTLLRLPLKKISIDSLNSDALENSIAVICCRNISNKYANNIAKTVNSSNASLISMSDTHQHQSLTDHLTLFLKMPFSKYELEDALAHCFNKKNNIPDIINLKYPIFEKLVGTSQEVRKLKTMIKQVAYSNTTVLILGQSGTGKDVVASCIHYLSERRDNPFVPINCGAIPSELMESELFGHEKGAFTGATSGRSGRFESANKGTLFLDEIGDMPMPMQVKLLRVIQDRIIERVGGCRSIEVDVRLIAATNKNLEKLIQDHHFREDLFYRLNVFPIYVPNLSERKEDIPALMDYHLEKIAERLKHRIGFTDRAKAILCEYSWPGNIRELQNFLERMVILFPECMIDEKDIEKNYRRKIEIAPIHIPLTDSHSFNIKEYLSSIEQQVIDSALKKSNGVITLAAKYLSMSKNGLLEKAKRYNLISDYQDK